MLKSVGLLKFLLARFNNAIGIDLDKYKQTILAESLGVVNPHETLPFLADILEMTLLRGINEDSRRKSSICLDFISCYLSGLIDILTTVSIRDKQSTIC